MALSSHVIFLYEIKRNLYGNIDIQKEKIFKKLFSGIN